MVPIALLFRQYESLDDLEASLDVVPPVRGKHSRSLLSFQADVYEQTFAPWRAMTRSLPDRHTCIVTGKPAQYRDPVTQQYYYDGEALKTLRGVIYRHFLANPIVLNDERVLEYVEWYEVRMFSTASLL